MTGAGAEEAAAPERRGLVPVLVFLAMVVAVISSLGAPLVPSVAAADDVALPHAQWSLTITLLVGAVATPVLGRLGDGPRRRAVMLGTLAVVVVGSALAALPLGFGWLVTGRGLQGFGLGLTPLCIATARDALAGPRSRSAIAALSVTVAAGVGFGYPVAGVVAEVGGVHAAFAFGGVVAALALVAGALVLPPSPAHEARPLDVVGAVLLGAGLAGGLLALSEGETAGWTSLRVLASAAVCVVALAVWVPWELRTPAPLVDLRLARGRTAATAHLAALLTGIPNYLLLSSVTLLAQVPRSSGYGFGRGVVVAGLLLLPFSVASVVAGRIAPWLARRSGPRALLPLGAVLLGGGMTLYATARGSLLEVCVATAVAGLGVGTAFAGLPTLLVTAVPARETGSAMSLNQVLRYLGFSVGSAATATVLEAATPAGTTIPGSGGFTVIAVIGLSACAVMLVVTLFLPARATAREA